jgi:hypothetical protein
MPKGDMVLKKPEWEVFAAAVAEGKKRNDAYADAFGGTNRKSTYAMSCRLLKRKEITDRITFLSKGRFKFARAPTDPNKDINLQSVIKTCQEVIDTSESVPQRLKAIEVLNKLGVFDGDAKDNKGRMDPAAICAWLAQFAGHPAENLAKIPDGLKGMLTALMELTGMNPTGLMIILDDIRNEQKPSELPIPKPSMPLESENPTDCGFVSIGNPAAPNAMFEKSPTLYRDPVLNDESSNLSEPEIRTNLESQELEPEKVEF